MIRNQTELAEFVGKKGIAHAWELSSAVKCPAGFWVPRKQGQVIWVELSNAFYDDGWVEDFLPKPSLRDTARYWIRRLDKEQVDSATLRS